MVVFRKAYTEEQKEKRTVKNMKGLASKEKPISVQ